MKKKSRSRSIDTVFVLIIFSAFAFCVLMVLTLGASIYKNINDITRDREDERMALSYVRTKVRNLDNAGAVGVAPFGDVTALHITEQIGSGKYTTVIYAYDGWLCELFSDTPGGFAPGDGMRIAQTGDLSFGVRENGIIEVQAGDLYLLLTTRSTPVPRSEVMKRGEAS